MQNPFVHLPPDLVRYDDEVVSLSQETWHLPRNIWRDVRKVSDGRGVKCAVLDTGIFQHPTLPNPFATKSFISGQTVLDRNGHGTHCLGTVLSRNEDIGVAPGAEAAVGKVLSDGGSGPSSGIADGINWAIDQNVDVISLSLGGGSSYLPTNVAIKRALDRGIIVCIAAGNSGFNGSTNTIGWPARSGEGVVVAALNQNYVPATFSSGGIQLTIASPGERILSCSHRGSGFVFMSGTSMACPFTAGCFCLIISHARSQGLPSMTGIEAVNKFVANNATDLLTPGHDQRTGHGMFSMLEVMNNFAKDTLIYV